MLRLERELGTRIFDRLPSGMRLTPAGELLLQHVRGTLQNFDKLLAEMDGLQGIRSGHVTLAALDSSAGRIRAARARKMCRAAIRSLPSPHLPPRRLRC